MGHAAAIVSLVLTFRCTVHASSKIPALARSSQVVRSVGCIFALLHFWKILVLLDNGDVALVVLHEKLLL